MRIINFGSLNIDKFGGAVCTAADHHRGLCRLRAARLSQSLAAARAGAEVLHAARSARKAAGDAAGTADNRLREVDGPSAVIDAAGQNRIIVFGGANRSMTSEYIERVLDTAQPDDWVLLQNEVNLVPEIICRAHEKGLRVVFNPSPVPENTEKLPLACVSLFMVNEIEAAQLAGTDANADFEDTLTALRAKYPNASVVMTVGADGVLYDGEEGRFQLPAFKVKAVDTTAAGDTFCGYFLAAVSAGKSVQTALQEASAASALAVSRTGAAPSVPTADEVREFLRRHA
ncbi:MAG: PfkB family carbohydrate kinase [Butyricicoccus sp.]